MISRFVTSETEWEAYGFYDRTNGLEGKRKNEKLCQFQAHIQLQSKITPTLCITFYEVDCVPESPSLLVDSGNDSDILKKTLDNGRLFLTGFQIV